MKENVSGCFFLNTVYILLHIRLLLYLFHNIQLEWHCIA